jgi:predicted RNA-binding protein with PUA-like domain
MAYFVFQVSDQSKYGKQKTAQEIFDFLVRERNVWGFGYRTANKNVIKTGDKVVFYVTGVKNQYFLATATLKTGAYEDSTGESNEWWLDPETLRIDLVDVQIFPEIKPRKSFKSLEWRPTQGGSSKLSERDYQLVLGQIVDAIESNKYESDAESEFILEKYLEEFIVSNWDRIDFGEKLILFEDENGNIGQQYLTEDAGYIDILAKDESGNFVVIELKKGRKNDEVIGQVLRYMGWVRKNLVTNNEDVRGLVIVGEKDNKLEYALQEVNGKVHAKIYKIVFRLEAF